MMSLLDMIVYYLLRSFEITVEILYVILVPLIHLRSPAIFTRLNYTFKNGGSLDVSKYEIFRQLGNSHFAATQILRPSDSKRSNLKKASCFARKTGFPIIMKPDISQRSIGVKVISDSCELEREVSSLKFDYILQEFVDYPHEIGVFVYRMPGEKKLTIGGIVEFSFSEAEKQIYLSGRCPSENRPSERTSLLATTLSRIYVKKISREDLVSDAVKKRFQELYGGKKIFYARLDLKVKDLERFRNDAEGFKILEVNLSADTVPLHASDKRFGFFYKLYTQLRYLHIAFRISVRNKGKKYTPLHRLVLQVFAYLRHLHRLEKSVPLVKP